MARESCFEHHLRLGSRPVCFPDQHVSFKVLYFYAITHEEVCVKSKIYERKISQEKKENFEKRGGN